MKCPSREEAVAGQAGDITVPKGLPKCSRMSLGVAGRCPTAANLASKFTWQEGLWE